MKYICLSCHYVHDDKEPSAYEADTTDFEDINSNWTCPLCGATREFFVEMA